MDTRILHLTSENQIDLIREAAMTLKIGGLVAFPTETVYGIGANALDTSIVRKIYEAKGRPSDNPLIVHIGDATEVVKYVAEIPEIAIPLMEAFWPGPLTIIFKKNPVIPYAITGGLDTVAIRVPAHPLAREIIRQSGLPIAAPSANISGKPSPTIATHVIEDLSGRIDMIVDGGDANIGLESTVLDVTSEPAMILRPGGVTKAMIEAVVGPVIGNPNDLGLSEEATPKAPGMKYKHYAPKGRLVIYYGSKEKAIEAMNISVQKSVMNHEKVGIIATKEDREAYNCSTVLTIGSEHDAHEIASNLFKILRQMDDLGIEKILTQAFHEKEIGVATMNRLLKAANNEQRFV
ncbi:MAG: threonylcarbamoyl-AMP synthase [Firmicutes bacterium HGW-Firmicutes-2]|jgi:L-threonylcarbamoyladenylate synthase|nr:MAG: threonylcarbamoyl-AMP synthase [Firmicutes bacterium HGW-Firmicutes-2]